MKRPRPYIPVKVRLLVAMQGYAMDERYRQRFEEAATDFLRWLNPKTIIGRLPKPSKKRLTEILKARFGDKSCHLDHDPPLRARAFNPRTGKYKPDANDPRFLIYRSQEEHRVKTYVRGEHGQYSDTILIARERKREKKKAGKLPTYRWPKRKMRSRKNVAIRANDR